MNYNKNHGYGALAVSGLPFIGSGKHFFVGDSGTVNRSMLQELYGVDPDGDVRFFATINAAMDECTASAGDNIFVMPGHTESITTASGIALDVAGVSVIGLGSGDLLPTITIASTDNAGTIVQSANSTVLKNIIVVTNDDALTNAVVVSGDACVTDIIHKDTSSAVEAATVVRGDTANNWTLKLVHKGFTAGNAGVSCVRLDDCDNVDITIDQYGKYSTAIVEMVDVASTNVKVKGTFYVSGTTDLTKNVVDTVTGSTWSVEGFDAAAGAAFSGGSGNAIAVGDLSAIASNITTIDGIVDDILVDTSTTIPASILALPKCVAKADGAVLTGNDDIFVITGGPVRAKIVGVVTTIIGGASNMDLQIVTTTPAATVDLNATPVAIDNDAAGTSYHNVGATSVFTPTTAGVVLRDPVTVEETEFILPIGTVHARSSAAQTGVIAWYMTYEPLSPGSSVSAAA